MFSSGSVRLGAATALACSAAGVSLLREDVNKSISTQPSISSHSWKDRFPKPLLRVADRASSLQDLRARTFSAASATATADTAAVAAAVASSGGGKGGSAQPAVQVEARGLRKRERRFQAFASCEHDGQMFMTAQDFLESVTKQEPRARRRRRALTDKDVSNMLASTPGLKKTSHHLFRDMWDNCLFSYPDYLFMLSVLTKPQRHFQIAFKMLDVDGSTSVDVKEFLKFQGAINKSSSLRSGEEVDSSSLIQHFFGQRGKAVIRFEDFFNFMDNLQREVLELEFLNHSQGMRVISEFEFAEILLRTAHISERDVEVYVSRLRKRLGDSHGITFDQFCNFDKFLNNLQDFSVCVKMFTMSGQSISQVQFNRAVKACMGYSLDDHLVDTVFKLFDADGDGGLSHEEFIAVMQNRVQRGFGGKRTGWDGFKACVRKEMNKKV